MKKLFFKVYFRDSSTEKILDLFILIMWKNVIKLEHLFLDDL